VLWSFQMAFFFQEGIQIFLEESVGDLLFQMTFLFQGKNTSRMGGWTRSQWRFK